MPIKNFDNEVIAVVQAINKINKENDSKIESFDENDILVSISISIYFK
jgi:hypothetical protein